MAEMLVDEETGTPYEAVEAAPQEAPVETSAETPEAEDISPKEKERRQLQSELDRTKNLLETLQREKEELSQIKPLYDLTTKDEEFRRHVDAYLNGGGKAPQAGAPVEKTLPTAPVRPEMPHDYSPEDARLDPSSSSAKYERELQRYRDARVEYVEAQLLTEREERNKLFQQQEAARQREQQLDQIAVRATRAHDIPEDDVSKYRAFIASVTPELEEEVYAFYFKHRGQPSPEEVVNKKREQDLRRQAEASKQSVPAGAATTTESDVPVEDGPPTQPLKKQVRGSLI